MGLLAKLFPPPSRDKFAAIMLRAFEQAGETRPVTYDPDGFCLRFDGAGVVWLHNAYNDYLRASRRQRREVLAHYSRVMRQREPAAQPLDQVRDKLLPRVRERFYHESVKLVGQLEGWTDDMTFPHKVISDDLTVEMVIDHPESVQVLGTKVLNDWHVTLDELLPVARENLWRISNEDFRQLTPGFYASAWQDTHDASRLFLHDLIWQLKVTGPHVAMVPERNILLVTGADDVENVNRMVQLAERVFTEQHRRMT